MNIITLGTFDLFHRGHMVLLRKCLELAGPDGKVVVALNTDEFIKKYKGKFPVVPYYERMETIRAFDNRFVVITNDQEDGTAKAPIMLADADLIVIGSDWARKDYVGQLGIDWDWLDDMDIGVCYVNYTSGVSTTMLKGRIYENT